MTQIPKLSKYLKDKDYKIKKRKKESNKKVNKIRSFKKILKKNYGTKLEEKIERKRFLGKMSPKSKRSKLEVMQRNAIKSTKRGKDSSRSPLGTDRSRFKENNLYQILMKNQANHIQFKNAMYEYSGRNGKTTADKEYSILSSKSKRKGYK